LKIQKWFKTDLGYYATKDRFLKSRGIVGDMQDNKGRLSFYLKGFKDVTFQITKHAKLSISYPREMKSYKVFLERVKPLLVKADGTPIEKIEELYDVSAGSKEEKIEIFFKEHGTYWKYEILHDADILVICNQLGLNPDRDKGLIFKVHARHYCGPFV